MSIEPRIPESPIMLSIEHIYAEMMECRAVIVRALPEYRVHGMHLDILTATGRTIRFSFMFSSLNH